MTKVVLPPQWAIDASEELSAFTVALARGEFAGSLVPGEVNADAVEEHAIRLTESFRRHVALGVAEDDAIRNALGGTIYTVIIGVGIKSGDDVYETAAMRVVTAAMVGTPSLPLKPHVLTNAYIDSSTAGKIARLLL